MTAKVFIVQDKQGLNFTSARKFGEIKFMLPAGTLLTHSIETYHHLADVLRDFRDEDFLVLTGDPEAMCMAYTCAAMFNNGRVKLLKWDNQEHCYNVVQHDINEL